MNKNKLKQEVIFFDLDGTLTESASGIIKTVQYAMERCGLKPPTMEELAFVVGPPLLDSFMGPLKMEREKAVAVFHCYRDRYAQTGMFDSRVYDGVVTLLKTLRKKGKRLGVATSKSQDFAVKIIDHFGLAPYFDFVAGSDNENFGARNTKAKVLAYGIQQMGVTKEDAVLVGDRMYDINGAKEVGVPVIAVEYGYGSMAEFLEHGADYIVKTPQEVGELF